MKPRTTLLLFYFLVILSISGACKNDNEPYILIENNSKFDYIEKVVAISWQEIIENYPSLDINNLKIIDTKTKQEVIYQLEYAGSKEIQNLLLQITLKTNDILKLALKNEKPRTFKIKTYGRYVPERLDDFAWENDKIAFRMYGKALELGGKGNAYGIDVWVKRTNRMIINERYKRGEYHVDHGDGMDYYHVGLTLGAGNIMPYINDSIWYSKNYYKSKILDQGPLRFTFQLTFEEWEVAGLKMSAIKTISLDAGSQLNKIEVEYNYNDHKLDKLPVVIGIIKRSGFGKELLNIEKGILGYWEPKHGDDGTTGIGIIIPSEVNDMKIRNNQYLALLKIQKNKPFVYYTGAVWDKAGFITNENQWFKYLNNVQEQLSDDGLIIQFKN